jgi:hypothetical protein
MGMQPQMPFGLYFVHWASHDAGVLGFGDQQRSGLPQCDGNQNA